MIEINEGLIALDSETGKKFGFTSDRFDSNSYLWCEEGSIWISFIRALNPGHGYFSQLVKAIRDHGFEIKVPIPFPRMEAILTHLGFERTEEYFEAFKAMGDVWVLRKCAKSYER